MEPDNGYKKRIRIITVLIIVAAVIGASLIVVFSLPGLGNFAIYQEYHTEATITPPASSYSISIAANNSNIQVYQGGNNSIFVDVTVSGWVRLTGDTVSITNETVGNAVNIVINTPRFLSAYTSSAKLYLPSGSMADFLTADTSNGNLNVNGPLKAQNFTLTTTNGNIGVSGLTSGRVDASTVNGNVAIAAITLSGCSENSVNGNLHLTLSDPVSTGTFSLTSVNGNQEMYLNKLSNATLSLSTVNGGITLSNLDLKASSSTTHNVQGTINGGGASINMKASNGNIRITGT